MPAADTRSLRGKPLFAVLYRANERTIAVNGADIAPNGTYPVASKLVCVACGPFDRPVQMSAMEQCKSAKGAGWMRHRRQSHRHWPHNYIIIRNGDVSSRDRIKRSLMLSASVNTVDKHKQMSLEGCFGCVRHNDIAVSR